MEDKVNSLKDAIDITLFKLKYNNNDTNIIKKLILNALSGKSDYFTRTNNAREYVSNLTRGQVLKELINNSTKSDDIDEIIDIYIKKNYKQSNECREYIKENSNLDKVSKKIRYFNIVSSDDNDFYNNVWDCFSKVFVGKQNEKKEEITSEEYLLDLYEAALRVAEQNHGQATVLKRPAPMSQNLSKEDAVMIVEEYVYQNNLEELNYFIKNNSIFSGLLQQNLLEYLYFNRKEKMDLSMIKNADEIFDNYKNLREQLIFQKMIGPEIPNFNFINRDELKLVMLQNSICMYILFKDINANFVPLTNDKLQNESIYSENLNKFYSLNKEEQQRLKDIYIGNSEVSNIKNIKVRTDITEEEKTRLIEREIVKAIVARKPTNDMIAKSIIEKGLNSTIEELGKEINNYDKRLIEYLTNMYAISRETKENKKLLNDVIYIATDEQSHAFNLLNNKELINQNIPKKTA